MLVRRGVFVRSLVETIDVIDVACARETATVFRVFNGMARYRDILFDTRERKNVDVPSWRSPVRFADLTRWD